MRSDFTDEDRHFARRLQGRRHAAMLSRLVLARRTKLSEATIKFIEMGRTKPTVRTVAALLQVPELALTLDDVPLSLRERVADVLEPLAPIAEILPPPAELRPCSGKDSTARLNEAQLGTLAFLMQVPRLKLTIQDVPRRWRRQVSDALELAPSAVCTAPSPEGLRRCFGG